VSRPAIAAAPEPQAIEPAENEFPLPAASDEPIVAPSAPAEMTQTAETNESAQTTETPQATEASETTEAPEAPEAAEAPETLPVADVAEAEQHTPADVPANEGGEA